MSFARFTTDGIYLFDHVDLGPVCWNCSLLIGKPEYYFAASVLDDMLAHVAEHRAAGDPIAFDVEQTLREEWDES